MNKDILTLAKDLREAGFDAEQAAVLAQCFARLPSREEMSDTEDRLRHEIRVQGEGTATQIKGLEDKIDAQGREIVALGKGLEDKIEVQGEGLATQIKGLEAKIDALGKEMAALSKVMTAQVARLDGRIDAVEMRMAVLEREMRMLRYGLYGLYVVIVSSVAPLAFNALINGGGL